MTRVDIQMQAQESNVCECIAQLILWLIAH